jgi:hypothetical protein
MMLLEKQSKEASQKGRGICKYQRESHNNEESGEGETVNRSSSSLGTRIYGRQTREMKKHRRRKTSEN